VELSALTSQLAPSIELWADLVRNATFDEEQLERLRGQWLAGIAQEKAQPVGLALRLLPPAIFGAGHAYGVPGTGSGTETSIASLTRADLAAFKRDWLRPDNARIFIVGDTSMAEIVPLLDRAFSGWNAPSTPLPTKNVEDVATADSARIILIDRPNSPQSLILAGHAAPGLGTDRDLAIEAMNEVLGGSFTARVNMNLREDKGWAYGAQTLLMEAEGPRPFIVYAPVQTDRTGDSLAELSRELRAIKSTRPIEAAEMDRVIAGLTRQLPGQFETASAVIESLASSARYGRPLDYAATLSERYASLKLSDLQSAADDLIHADRLTWIVVGDLELIRAQVERAGIAPIEIWDEDGKPVAQ
jgi:zinc protease